MSVEPFRLNGASIGVNDPELFMRQAHGVLVTMGCLFDAGDEEARTLPIPMAAAAIDAAATLVELAAFALARMEAIADARKAYQPEPPSYL